MGKFFKQGGRYFCVASGNQVGKTIVTDFEVDERFPESVQQGNHATDYGFCPSNEHQRYQRWGRGVFAPGRVSVEMSDAGGTQRRNRRFEKPGGPGIEKRLMTIGRNPPSAHNRTGELQSGSQVTPMTL